MSRVVRRLVVIRQLARAITAAGDSFALSDSAHVRSQARSGTDSWALGNGITQTGHGLQASDSFSISDAATHP